MKLRLAFVTIAVACTALTSRGSIAPFSNLGQTNDTNTEHFGNLGQQLATDFETSSGSATITGITLSLENPDTIAHNITVSLFSNSNGIPVESTTPGEPGTSLGSFPTLSDPGNQTSPTDASVAGNSFSLSPNTIYWVVLTLDDTISNGNAVIWAGTSSQNTDDGSLFSTVPATDAEAMNVDFPWAAAFPGNYQFELTGTVVPEPSTFVLLALGVTLAIESKQPRWGGNARVPAPPSPRAGWAEKAILRVCRSVRWRRSNEAGPLR